MKMQMQTMYTNYYNYYKPSFKAYMSQEDVKRWNGPKDKVYMNLNAMTPQAAMDIDEKTGKNFLHYVFACASDAGVLNELRIKIRPLSQEQLKTLLTQKDRNGKVPFDYCISTKNKATYQSLIKGYISLASLNEPSAPEMVEVTPEAPKAEAPKSTTTSSKKTTQTPVSTQTTTTTTTPVTSPITTTAQAPTVAQAQSPAQAQAPVATSQPAETIDDGLVGNELPDDADDEELPATRLDRAEDQPEVIDVKAEDVTDKVEKTERKQGETPQLVPKKFKSFADVPGLESVKKQLNDQLIDPIKTECLAKMIETGLTFQNRFILYGPNGSGKSTLLEAIAGELNTEPQIIKDINELPGIMKKAKSVFEKDLKTTLVCFEDIHTMFSPDSKEIYENLFSESVYNGVVIVATADSEASKNIEPIINSVRCFNQIIQVPAPNYEDRVLIIQSVLNDTKQKMENGEVKKIADSTSGLSRAAVVYIAEQGIRKEITVGNGTLDFDDFKPVIDEYAKQRNIGTMMKENPTSAYDTVIKRYISNYPKDFSDVAGMEDVKSQFAPIAQRLKNKNYKENGIPPVSGGFLLQGEPGTGKTFLAEALAGELGIPLYKLTKEDYEDSRLGESGKKLQAIFNQLAKKFEETGEYSLLLIDEADTVLPQRSSGNNYDNTITNQMNQLMNNCIKRGIIPILATNYPNKIDEAIKRPGRIATVIEVSPPDFAAKKAILELNLKKIKTKKFTEKITEENLIEITKLMEGFTAAEVARVAQLTIEKSLDANQSMTVDDFKLAIKQIAKERGYSPDFSYLERTAKFDTQFKRARIQFPRNFSDVAGMEPVKEVFSNYILKRLDPKAKQALEKNGYAPFKGGILLTGEPGNGKTFLVEALAGEAKLPLYVVTKADYDSSLKGESIKNIKALFDQLENKYEKTGEYSILFFDEADALFPKRGSGNNLSDEETNTMLTYLNNASKKGIIVILATNNPDKIDDAVKRGGRVGKHIEVPAPDIEARKVLLQKKILGKDKTENITEENIMALAKMLSGFSMANITEVTDTTIEEAITDLNREQLTMEDFRKAFAEYARENNLPEVDESNVTSSYDTKDFQRLKYGPGDPRCLDDVGGMQAAKQAIYESLVAQSKPEMVAFFKANGLKAPNGVLLYGPSGCGKTFIMKAVAGELGLPIYQMKMSDVGSPYINQTSNNMRAIFKQLEHKYIKTGEPSILFLDECDSFFARNNGLGGNSERNQDLNTLKTEMDNAGRRGIIIVAATNEIQNIDSAILRDGRFDTKIKIDYPDEEARFDIIQKDLKKRKLTAEYANDEQLLGDLVKSSDTLPIVSIVKAISDCILKVNSPRSGMTAAALKALGTIKPKPEQLLEFMKVAVQNKAALNADVLAKRMPFV